jgi:hypothetical protein
MEKFHERCGIILTQTLNVETVLDMFLYQYFCAGDTAKAWIFHDELLVNPEYGLNFFQKQKLLSAICKKEEIDITQLKKDLTFIIKTRNKVAHHERYWGGNQTVLYPRKSSINVNTGLELTNQLMKEIEDTVISANSRINALYQKLTDNKRVSKPLGDLLF